MRSHSERFRVWSATGSRVTGTQPETALTACADSPDHEGQSRCWPFPGPGSLPAPRLRAAAPG